MKKQRTGVEQTTGAYVQRLHSTPQVVELLRELVSHLGPEDRDKVFYSTARDFYKLKL